MKSLLLVVLSLGLAAPAFAEDAPKKEKSDSPPPKRTYEPLIIPGGQGNPASVPQPGKDLPADTEKEDAAISGPESSSAGRMPLPMEDEKKKKQELWIYTLPDEEAARKKQQEQEQRQFEQAQEIRRSGQLPEWAVDPEFRKYFLEQDPLAVPNAGTQGPSFFDMGLDWKTPKGLGDETESESAESSGLQGAGSLKESDRGLFSTGTTLSTGKDPGDPGEAKAATSRPSGDATDYDQLYQSNQKQKRMEDFHDGLNKPMEVEESSDRYHKPQKPQ